MDKPKIKVTLEFDDDEFDDFLRGSERIKVVRDAAMRYAQHVLTSFGHGDIRLEKLITEYKRIGFENTPFGKQGRGI